MPLSIGNIQQQLPTQAPQKAKPVKTSDTKLAVDRAALEEERIYRRGTVTLRDIVAPASFDVKPTFLLLSGVYVRTLFVITYPRHIGLGWSSPLININKTFDIAMFFYPIKANIILKQLQKKVGILEAGLMADAEKGAPRDPLRETALRDIEALRDALTQGIEHFFQFSFYITIYGALKNLRSLQEVESRSAANSSILKLNIGPSGGLTRPYPSTMMATDFVQHEYIADRGVVSIVVLISLLIMVFYESIVISNSLIILIVLVTKCQCRCVATSGAVILYRKARNFAFTHDGRGRYRDRSRNGV